ncbi:protoporphyrinogen oxidase [Posidoniimonas polymericola]|uniref:Protoporphyrinogen oxidase n=1 Tax=Posidoniimonas polymericola TaxID=2528002 RepID=A0A5C5XUG2_9BACT|nr:NAD(P)/FAD-dependent oxidoreductase [Posidoniimonas polymericola]TWT66877.1 protoporphyrinogen oxidase [Posidoniimonas polymericola]
MQEWDVIIVGAGIAGLTCAEELCFKKLNVLVVEAAETPGGRIATDDHDGFLLDRGFQVLLTSYPETRRRLDYTQLNLCRFEPGALIWRDGEFHRFTDPWRRPKRLVSTALSPVATLSDKLRVAKFRRSVTSPDLEQLYERPETTTIEMLQQRGFSSTIIERFFRPFLGGVFLDHELQTSSRLCEFVFRMFSTGDAAIPAAGMRSIPQQLADRLPPGALRLNSPVNSVGKGMVELASGERLAAKQVVVATEAPAAARLIGQPSAGEPLAGEANRVACLYFAADKPPVKEPILVLNGEGQGPVNNLCVPSQVAVGYAPRGQSLISVTALEWDNLDDLQAAVLEQLHGWFGQAVDSWRHLRTYPIEYALPRQTPPALSPVQKSPRTTNGVHTCGDYCDTASINGAMASGRLTAEAVAGEMG